MKVFVHTKETAESSWNNVGCDFKQVPAVGEHIALAWNGAWYKVEVVVHCPFEATYDAEIYAIKVEMVEAIRTPFLH